ncbi:uncharacterized protein LOC144209777 [Stigmatopora nigra]
MWESFIHPGLVVDRSEPLLLAVTELNCYQPGNLSDFYWTWGQNKCYQLLPPAQTHGWRKHEQLFTRPLTTRSEATMRARPLIVLLTKKYKILTKRSAGSSLTQL